MTGKGPELQENGDVVMSPYGSSRTFLGSFFWDSVWIHGVQAALKCRSNKNYFTSCDPHHDIYTFCYWQICCHSI